MFKERKNYVLLVPRRKCLLRKPLSINLLVTRLSNFTCHIFWLSSVNFGKYLKTCRQNISQWLSSEDSPIRIAIVIPVNKNKGPPYCNTYSWLKQHALQIAPRLLRNPRKFRILSHQQILNGHVKGIKIMHFSSLLLRNDLNVRFTDIEIFCRHATHSGNLRILNIFYVVRNNWI